MKIRNAELTSIRFQTPSSGDFDGVAVFLEDACNLPSSITVSRTVGGHVKVGDALKGNPHQVQPEFSPQTTAPEANVTGVKSVAIQSGVDLLVSIEAVPVIALPRDVRGEILLKSKSRDESQAVYFVGREWNGGKVITSPLFVKWQ